MDGHSLKDLVINTAKEYKHTFGSDLKTILKELSNLEIKYTNNIEKNKVESIFEIKIFEEKLNVFLVVEKKILSKNDTPFFEEILSSSEFVRMTIFMSSNNSNNKDDIFEYYIDLYADQSEPYTLTKNDEFHQVNSENCEEIRKLVLPSCDLVSFFDIFFLSLVRSTIPILTDHLEWQEAKIPFRNSLIEHIASENCSSTESEDYLDSELEIEFKRKQQKLES